MIFYIIMDDFERIKVSEDTQKFITYVSKLPNDKYNKVMDLIENLKNQQEAEAHLENKRGWRYMWQRTPKPYLLMLGYLVFLAPVGSFGYQAFSYMPDENKIIYLIILATILILPLLVVFYLSYHYVQRQEESEKDCSLSY
ncbi:MAG: hypothetical protein SYNGOMJ08_00188 [Candidatus Syntrophoarchaeum sp. GoM_oil]|nr:MAG: hypothetical protein SYNGOMJ08_00188 [Candidatus Syntrophoarchaeum sp. GoM_oil]